MKLFTVGPVEMYDEILQIRAKQLPYFRTAEFSQMMIEADEILKRVIHAPEEAKTVYLTASGTGAMEATVMNCFSQQDKVLIINGGGFGQRFVDICKIHDIPYTEIKVDFNMNITKELLEQYSDCGYTGFLVNIHETSIGKLYPIDVISDFCEKNNLYLIVDAISSLFADTYDMEKYHIDATIFSSQKALALAPGMAVVVMSGRIVENRVLKNTVKSMYFDFKDYLHNFERGQTPFTPAVGIFIEFANMLKIIDEMSINKKVEDTKSIASQFRNMAKDMGFEMPAFTMSNALTTLVFEKNAKKIYTTLKEQYDYVVTPCGGEMADKLLRIGHMGNLAVSDFEELLKAMKEVCSMYNR